MSYSALASYLSLSSPESVADQTGDFKSYTYRGPSSTLATNRPSYGDDWNGATVRRTRLQELDLSGYSVLVVDAGTDGTPGTLTTGEVTNNEFPFYEIDWVGFEKSLRAHPAFATMTDAMWQAVDSWIAETDSVQRALGKYWERDSSGLPTGTLQSLPTTASPTKSAANFAGLYLKGVQSYVDYLPVARKTALYEGQTKPTSAGCGAKITGDPFTGVPSGYVWQKTGDKATKQGRGYKWTKTEEWTGAIAMLLDVTTIF